MDALPGTAAAHSGNFAPEMARGGVGGTLGGGEVGGDWPARDRALTLPPSPPTKAEALGPGGSPRGAEEVKAVQAGPGDGGSHQAAWAHLFHVDRPGCPWKNRPRRGIWESGFHAPSMAFPGVQQFAVQQSSCLST